MATYGIKSVIYGNKTVVETGLTREEAHAKADPINEMAKAKGIYDDMKMVVFIEMNAHEKATDKLISDAVSEIIGGYENLLNDSAEGSEDWETAKSVLNHDRLFDMIYDHVMYYSSNKRHASHIRFAGKAFIEERIEKRLEKEGYGK